MGHQIIKQPNGQLAVFSSITDTFIIQDAAPEQLVELYAERAAEQERRAVREILEHVLADEPRRAYFQFARTYAKAYEIHAEHGGNLVMEVP